MTVEVPERLSIELTNRCSKACSFCYNHSGPDGERSWRVGELVEFVDDCVDHGTKAVSFGGGEPLQYEGLFELFGELEGRLFRSVTTNGLLLRDDMMEKLVDAHPDKVHISLHYPSSEREVDRVIEQVSALDALGVVSGINFLVRRSRLDAAIQAAARVRAAGIGNERIVYLPMRGGDTPTPREMGRVAGGVHFQSMSCLMQCGRSPRFCTVGFDHRVSWCSYTTTRRKLESVTAAGLAEALDGLGLVFCGGESWRRAVEEDA